MPIYSSDSDGDQQHPHSQRLFGREQPMHAILGGGKVADILLWRNKNTSSAIFLGFTMIWFLFEVVEYNFVTLISHIFIGIMVILFIWSTVAGFVDWAPPDYRAVMISEATFHWLLAKINLLVLKLYAISSGKNMRTFFLAITFLWILSVIGNDLSSLNLLYIGFICLMALPALYEKYQNEVDYLALKGKRGTKKLLKNLDAKVLNKIPRGPIKQRKKY